MFHNYWGSVDEIRQGRQYSKIRQMLGSLLKSFAGDPIPLVTKIPQRQHHSRACSLSAKVNLPAMRRSRLQRFVKQGPWLRRRQSSDRLLFWRDPAKFRHRHPAIFRQISLGQSNFRQRHIDKRGERKRAEKKGGGQKYISRREVEFWPKINSTQNPPPPRHDFRTSPSPVS